MRFSRFSAVPRGPPCVEMPRGLCGAPSESHLVFFARRGVMFFAAYSPVLILMVRLSRCWLLRFKRDARKDAALLTQAPRSSRIGWLCFLRWATPPPFSQKRFSTLIPPKKIQKANHHYKTPLYALFSLILRSSRKGLGHSYLC